ncbi:WD-40 repeat family protein, partial [Striga asiatica]
MGRRRIDKIMLNERPCGIRLTRLESPKGRCQGIIDAHAGGVNAIGFAHPNKQLCVVTCGDELIKVYASEQMNERERDLLQVWDLAGKKLFNFESHDATCLFYVLTRKRIFSYGLPVSDNKKWHVRLTIISPFVDYFPAGQEKTGIHFWLNRMISEGAIKRKYIRFRKKSAGVVQYDHRDGLL